MDSQNINKRDLITHQSLKQKQFYKSFAKDYLHYLGNPNPISQQLAEIQAPLSQVWVQRLVCLDSRLTNREQQCLYFLGKGIKEIATFLAISERQVERYRNSIF